MRLLARLVLVCLPSWLSAKILKVLSSLTVEASESLSDRLGPARTCSDPLMELLPLDLQLKVFMELRVDERLAARCVSRAWRSVLSSHPSLYTSLDFTGVPETLPRAAIDAAMLLGAGQTRSLDLTGCDGCLPREWRTRYINGIPVWLDGKHTASLTELRISGAAYLELARPPPPPPPTPDYHYPGIRPDIDLYMEQMKWMDYDMALAAVKKELHISDLLEGCPNLRLLELDARLSMDSQNSMALLKKEAPYQSISVRKCILQLKFAGELSDNELVAFLSLVEQHRSLTEVTLVYVPLGSVERLEATVTALLGMEDVSFLHCGICEGGLRALTRLLTDAPSLRELHIDNAEMPSHEGSHRHVNLFEDAEDALPAFLGALSTCSLYSIRLAHCGLFGFDFAGDCLSAPEQRSVATALARNASLTQIVLKNDGGYGSGMAEFAGIIIRADSEALTRLFLKGNCGLQENDLVNTVFAALRQNTHLQHLRVEGIYLPKEVQEGYGARRMAECGLFGGERTPDTVTAAYFASLEARAKAACRSLRTFKVTPNFHCCM